jgi:hypothetical protein
VSRSVPATARASASRVSSRILAFCAVVVGVGEQVVVHVQERGQGLQGTGQVGQARWDGGFDVVPLAAVVSAVGEMEEPGLVGRP